MESIMVVCDVAAERRRVSDRRVKARYVKVKALESNEGPVYVGDAFVSRHDPGLSPGRSIGIRGYPVVDVFDLFVVARHAGSGVEVRVG